MIKCFKKAISSVLAAAMLATSFTAMPINTFAATSFSTAGGWFETLYAEWSGNKSDVTGVSYSGTASGSLTGDDLTYLVRQDGSNVRLDIPGLKAGTYNLTVTTNSGTITKENIKVYEYDRSGYAHYDAHKEGVTGIGAYNDDGTLKSNAVVVYVTEENKNTVQLPGYTGSQYPAGIGNILNYKSEDANGVTGGGKIDIVQQLRAEGIPLDVRFVGTVRGGDSNTSNNPPAENIKGLTGYNTTTNGGTKGDNGMMIRVYKSSNVTIEGIGDDATLDGWGIQIISQTGYTSQSFEFRNLNFTNTPEDAIGLEGTCAISSSPQTKEWFESNGYAPIKFSWVHNNTFHQGFCKNPAESDKAEGDGSCDWKRGYGYTMAYNHYINNHKTNLIGSSSSSIQYDASLHHNWYEKVESRQPLSRQANIHIYNTYFDGATSYAISPRAHAYIFSEGNYFGACKNPVDSAKEGSATVKSYNDSFAGCNGANAAQQVKNKTDKVSDSSGNPYAGFETGSDMYEYTATSPIQAKADCLNLAGVMKTASEINMEPTPEPIVSENPDALTLPYEVNFTTPSNANYWTTKTSETNLAANSQYNISNALVTPAAKITNTATTMKIRDNGVIFKVNKAADVTFTAGSSSAYGIELYDAYGELKLYVAGGKTATVSNIPAGVYVIKSGNTQKDGYLENLKIVANDPNAPTVTEATTQETTEATTAAPVDGVNVVVGNAMVKNGSAVTVPVKLTGMTDLADFNITLTYDAAALTATKVENGDIINDSMATINSNITDGSVRIAGINPADKINADGTVLVKVTFTANKEGATPVAITVNTLKGANLAVANYTTSNGTVTVTANGGSVETSTETTTTETDSTTEATTVDYSAKGDVNKDGKINEKDAALILKFIQGIKDETFYDEAAADANGDGVINALDATWVLNHKGNTSKPSTPETKTYTLTGTDINATSGTALTADTNVGTENMFLAKTGVKNSSGSVQISGSKTVQFKLTSDGTVALTNAISSGAYARQVAIVNSNGDTVATLNVENKNGAKNNLSATSLVAGTYTIKGVNVDSSDKSTSGSLNSSVNIGTITVTGTLEQISAEATTKTTVTTTTETTTETTTKATTTTEATTTTTTEATTETTTVTPAGDIVATINASDLTAGDITANTVSGQFKLIADATNKLTIEANSKSLDGYEFTQRLKTNGTGAVDKRAISFTTTGAGNVIFYAMSGSNKEDRPVNLLNAEGATVGTVTVSGTTFAKYTIAIPSAGTYYLVSGKSGINFYLIGTDVALADQKADATTVTTTTTETSTEATTVTTTTKADDTTETTTTAPADKAFAVSGDSWSAENDSVPTWLNGGKLTTATNSSSYKAFAAESANGTAFTKTVNVAADSSITIDVADALTASVFIAGDNNAANKGVIKATFTDESGTVTDITPADANLGGRKTATTAFELVATGKGTITVTPDYNSLLYKVTVK